MKKKVIVFEPQLHTMIFLFTFFHYISRRFVPSYKSLWKKKVLNNFCMITVIFRLSVVEVSVENKCISSVCCGCNAKKVNLNMKSSKHLRETVWYFCVSASLKGMKIGCILGKGISI